VASDEKDEETEIDIRRVKEQIENFGLRLNAD
jgi:hypothetical protein